MSAALSPLPPPQDPQDGPLAMLDRLFGHRGLRRLGMVLSLGVVLLIPAGAFLANSMRPTTPPAAEPPPLIQPPRDPTARAQYEGEVQTLLLEAARLKAAGVPASDISRQMDPRLREINLRFRGR